MLPFLPFLPAMPQGFWLEALSQGKGLPNNPHISRGHCLHNKQSTRPCMIFVNQLKRDCQRKWLVCQSYSRARLGILYFGFLIVLALNSLYGVEPFFLLHGAHA